MEELNFPFSDELREECGVFGIFHSKDAAAHTALGLHALQHRGQEGAGIVSTDGKAFYHHLDRGHVGDIFNKPEIVEKLKGKSAIGHVRYSTVSDKDGRDFQPLFAEFSFGKLALAHNGNLTNAKILRKRLIEDGSIFNTSLDSEVIIHLIAQSKLNKPEDRVVDALKEIQGAYSLVVLLKNMLVAVRDPHGIRPLAIGKIKDSFVIASESCAFDIIGAEFIREIEPGEMVIVNESGINSYFPFEKKAEKFCVFEYIYFSRPDSFVANRHVYDVRKKIGRMLAEESHVDADIVVPVPDSGVPSAMGYAEASNLKFEFGIIRNHYVGRTFIEPTDNVRHLGVKLKHNANLQTIRGKRVILIDDSIVRGTTSKKIVDMLRFAGAKEIHMRISSPPTTHSCFYGVDTPNRNKLMAANHSIEEMTRLIGADSLAFISLDGLYKAVVGKKRDKKCPQFCDACFSGEYPLEVEDLNPDNMPLFE